MRLQNLENLHAHAFFNSLIPSIVLYIDYLFLDFETEPKEDL